MTVWYSTSIADVTDNNGAGKKAHKGNTDKVSAKIHFRHTFQVTLAQRMGFSGATAVQNTRTCTQTTQVRVWIS